MKDEPLPFSSPVLSDAPGVRALTSGAMGSDLAFANLYLLQKKYGTTIAVQDECLFRHYGGSGRLQGYAFPCGGGDKEAALCRVETDACVRRRPVRFCLLTEEEKELLERLRPGVFCFTADPGDADYIYRGRDLAELPGTVYHRKRNHISRFEKNYPDWSFLPLNRENGEAALGVAGAWMEGRETPALVHEWRAMEHALAHWEELELCGGLIMVAQQPVAMSVASFISPTVADVHYEKCLPAFRDVYPLINRELARCLGCEFINREEDLNIPGLRKAKESYYPAQLLTKYTAYPHHSC